MVKGRMQLCKKWAVLSLLNFVLVSLAGVLLRYKISFSLPAVKLQIFAECAFTFRLCGMGIHGYFHSVCLYALGRI